MSMKPQSVASEVQVSSSLGRTIQKLYDTGASKKRVSMAKSMGGQIPLSSPLGRWLLKEAVAKDAGNFNTARSHQALAPAGAQEQLSSPLGQFARRLT